MKFQPHDVVRRVLPSGTMVGGLMLVVCNMYDKRTAVRSVHTRKCEIYKSSSLEKVGETIKIMVSKKDMDRIDSVSGIGTFFHELSTAYDRLYAIKPRFVCFILANKNGTIRRTFQLGKISRVLKKVGEIRKGYQMVPIKQPMYKIQLIGEL